MPCSASCSISVLPGLATSSRWNVPCRRTHAEARDAQAGVVQVSNGGRKVIVARRGRRLEEEERLVAALHVQKHHDVAGVAMGFL